MEVGRVRRRAAGRRAARSTSSGRRAVSQHKSGGRPPARGAAAAPDCHPCAGSCSAPFAAARPSSEGGRARLLRPGRAAALRCGPACWESPSPPKKSHHTAHWPSGFLRSPGQLENASPAAGAQQSGSLDGSEMQLLSVNAGAGGRGQRLDGGSGAERSSAGRRCDCHLMGSAASLEPQGPHAHQALEWSGLRGARLPRPPENQQACRSRSARGRPRQVLSQLRQPCWCPSRATYAAAYLAAPRGSCIAASYTRAAHRGRLQWRAVS